jgi:hypothetical protein
MKTVALLPFAIAVAVAQGAAQAPRDPLAAYLTHDLRVSDGEMAALARGGVVTRVLNTRERREVAALGVVHIAAPAAAFVDAVLDVEKTRRRMNASQVGRFGEPPRLDDVAALTLDEGDLAALRRCRVGDCDLKLPAAAIDRFRTDVMWSAPEAHAQANTAFRRVLVDLVSAYVRDGNAALFEYADQSERVSLPGEVRALVGESSYVAQHAPALVAALAAPPPAPRRPDTDVIYWSKEAQSGAKPVVTVTHLIVYRPRDGGPHAAFIASKQLYASHYFEASLALTAVVPTDGSDAAGADVMYLNRSRMDVLRGGWTTVKRSVANRRIRRALETGLLQMKRLVEGSGPPWRRH